jgi:hypothetical protein
MSGVGFIPPELTLGPPEFIPPVRQGVRFRHQFGVVSRTGRRCRHTQVGDTAAGKGVDRGVSLLPSHREWSEVENTDRTCASVCPAEGPHVSRLCFDGLPIGNLRQSVARGRERLGGHRAGDPPFETRAEDDLSDIEDEWDKTVRRYQRDYADFSRSVRDVVADCRGLAAGHQTEIQRLAGHAEEMARQRHLRLHSLFDASIPKVGVGRKQILAANGITSAADVDWQRIRNISGFGDALTGNVVAWRDEVSQQFRFDPRSGVSPADHRALASRFRTRHQQLLAEAEKLLGQLESLAPTCHMALTSLEPDLRAAVAEWEQAEADLRVLARRG